LLVELAVSSSRRSYRRPPARLDVCREQCGVTRLVRRRRTQGLAKGRVAVQQLLPSPGLSGRRFPPPGRRARPALLGPLGLAVRAGDWRRCRRPRLTCVSANLGALRLPRWRLSRGSLPRWKLITPRRPSTEHGARGAVDVAWIDLLAESSWRHGAGPNWRASCGDLPSRWTNHRCGMRRRSPRGRRRCASSRGRCQLGRQRLRLLWDAGTVSCWTSWTMSL
jgi:hypothetical protein